ncbi:CDP-glycerol glycerophosphotransferase (TagB/SpsB family) [Loktanella ponticola]|uniref:CDP-glycerol glycerophosphotransferase (TagB/SpsB family) n=1 Tax=Yoonia ponticola TaxID=1524255 RepID=A0A7W9BNH5_9RHOB|nr:CDP-glycerol glycerophosphotransferase family protein [Yoonia ponticola]MBB5723602.1 CDP-glycerol glycerophosphotransferase (TagB/SpsB family) [Yoonia ponticola]
MNEQRISVIIAAYNVENFIEEAVSSALQQTPAFYEVIVVNDASTDRTLEVINRAVGNHTNVRVVTNVRNIGLGPVRNLGTAQATGDYIAYLDGDDVFTPNAHTKMQEAIITTPDVAIVNHARLYEDGKVVDNVLSRLLTSRVHETVDERVKLFNNLNVAWNKVYRRNFLLSSKLTFPAGKYEDIAWNYAVLMMAKTIVTIPDVAILYRQRQGSILRSRDDAHFDIFDRWAELWKLLERNPQWYEQYGQALALRRFNSLLTVLDNKDRLPPKRRYDFAQQIEALCEPRKNFRASVVGRSSMLLGSRPGFTLRNALKSEMYLSVRESKAVKYVRKTARNLRARLNLSIYNNVLVRLPVAQDMVIYESYWGKKIDCNPYDIFTHLLDTAPGKYLHVWVARDGVEMRRTAGNAVHVREKTLRYFYYIARARILITNANFPTEVIKRKGTIHVQTKHGTPLKFMGLNILRKNPSGLGNTNAFAQRCKRWDYVISSNEYSSRIWRQGFPYNFKILETGYPRNDRLVTATPSERAAMRETLGLPADKRVVLYAPTFRSASNQKNPTDYPDKETIISTIMAGLDEDSVLAVRDHYFLAPDSSWLNNSRVMDVSAHASSTDVLLATDMLITDYSSIMFDFAVQKRPIVIFAYDKIHYEATRGTYFDISEEHPGVYCETLSELETALRDDHALSPEAKASMDAFHTKFCAWDDGYATARVCEIVFAQSQV